MPHCGNASPSRHDRIRELTRETVISRIRSHSYADSSAPTAS
jgi:hypothetical protein